ncbi:longitudinals lacking, partial [Carabus blaptoides fortunei]
MIRKAKPRTRVGPSSPTLETPAALVDEHATTRNRESTSRAGPPGTTRKQETQDPQPSSSAPRAAPPRLGLTVRKDGAKLNPGPRPVSTLGASGTDPTPYSCEQCGKSYKLKSSLARHAKECGLSDRRKCLHCK